MGLLWTTIYEGCDVGSSPASKPLCILGSDCHIKYTKTVSEYWEKAPWEFDKSLCKAKAEGSEGHKVKLSVHRHTCTLLVSQDIMCADTLHMSSLMEFS
jgi:hypothetical protein